MKADERTTRFLRPGLNQGKAMFKRFIEKRNQTKFLIVFVNECSFISTTVPRYS